MGNLDWSKGMLRTLSAGCVSSAFASVGFASIALGAAGLGSLFWVGWVWVGWVWGAIAVGAASVLGVGCWSQAMVKCRLMMRMAAWRMAGFMADLLVDGVGGVDRAGRGLYF